MSEKLSNGFHCKSCGKVFSSISGFDGHRYGSYTQKGPDYGRNCLTESELLSKNWSYTDSWKMPMTEKGLERLKMLKEKRESEEI